MVTMFVYLLIMVVDAAHGFGEDDDDKPASSTYNGGGGGGGAAYMPSKPTQNKTSYQPSPAIAMTTTTSTTVASRRAAPAAPKEPSPPRPKSTKGEILVALYPPRPCLSPSRVNLLWTASTARRRRTWSGCPPFPTCAVGKTSRWVDRW